MHFMGYSHEIKFIINTIIIVVVVIIIIIIIIIIKLIILLEKLLLLYIIIINATFTHNSYPTKRVRLIDAVKNAQKVQQLQTFHTHSLVCQS